MTNESALSLVIFIGHLSLGGKEPIQADMTIVAGRVVYSDETGRKTERTLWRRV